MELFTQAPKTYATRERAIQKLREEINLFDVRWLIAVTEEGRYFPVVIGSTDMNLCHRGVCVAS